MVDKSTTGGRQQVRRIREEKRRRGSTNQSYARHSPGLFWSIFIVIIKNWVSIFKCIPLYYWQHFSFSLPPSFSFFPSFLWNQFDWKCMTHHRRDGRSVLPAFFSKFLSQQWSIIIFILRQFIFGDDWFMGLISWIFCVSLSSQFLGKTLKTWVEAQECRSLSTLSGGQKLCRWLKSLLSQVIQILIQKL